MFDSTSAGTEAGGVTRGGGENSVIREFNVKVEGFFGKASVLEPIVPVVRTLPINPDGGQEACVVKLAVESIGSPTMGVQTLQARHNALCFVDDDPDTAIMEGVMAARRGFPSVFSVSGGRSPEKTALNAMRFALSLKSDGPQQPLFLVDLMMPDVDGLTLIAALKKTLPRASFALLTASPVADKNASALSPERQIMGELKVHAWSKSVFPRYPVAVLWAISDGCKELTSPAKASLAEYLIRMGDTEGSKQAQGVSIMG